MKVQREELLNVLESVSPGLATREFIEQSSCFGFIDGRVVTYNNEVACTRRSPLKIEGAVKAEALLSILGKLSEDIIDVEVKDGQLLIRGKRRKLGIQMELDVLLPLDEIENPEDDQWKDLSPDFTDAVRIVHTCTGNDKEHLLLMCVHIHPNHLEACDCHQMARYPVETELDESILVRGESLKKIIGFDMTQFCVTSDWIHFRNPAGLVLSCRRFLDDYSIAIDEFLTNDGIKPVILPGDLEEVVSRAEIFSSDNAISDHVRVVIGTNKLRIEASGVSGWYQEVKKISYVGERFEFLIAPKMLVEITKKSHSCGVAEGRLLVDTGKFKYVTCTQLEEDDELETVG